MSGVGFVLAVDDIEVRHGLDGLERLVGDWTPVLDDIGAELESSTVLRFDTNIAPDDTPWTPSAAALLRGSPTLVETGHFRDGIHYRLDGASAVEVGSNAAQAAVFQAGFSGEVSVSAHERHFTQVFGRPIAGVANVSAHTRHMEIEAREYLGMSVNDDAAVLDILAFHVRRAGGLN